MSSDHSGILFSPLPSPQSTPTQTSTPTQHTPTQHTPTHSQDDPTPLTISAHDMDGGSKDFTEYANGFKSVKDSVNKENGLATPTNTPTILATPTNTPTIPLRVRISAKKLREIQSPYESSCSSLEDHSPLLKGEGLCSTGHTHPRTSTAPQLVIYDVM